MKTYDIFHGYTLISEIGKELRKIIINEKSSFKILTGYGSTTGYSKSKQAALRSLAKIKKEGLIKGYFPGEVREQLLSDTSPYYDSKIQFEAIVRKDKDYGNDGIIFIFK